MIERKCAYCREALREGATVCHACAQEQPEAVAARNRQLRNHALAVTAFSVWEHGSAGRSWSIGSAPPPSTASSNACICMATRSWMPRVGAQYSALSYRKSGSVDAGECFGTAGLVLGMSAADGELAPYSTALALNPSLTPCAGRSLRTSRRKRKSSAGRPR